jgi:DNA-binding response OmpR family regulator
MTDGLINTTGAKSGLKENQRILMVDSDRDMLKLLNRTLKLEGFDTVVVADGDEALSLLDKIRPDMVIMDTVETDSDNLDIIDRLRQHSNVPIIILTSDNEVETLRKVFAHGADDFVRKPFGAKLFIARIKAKLRRYKQKVHQ